MRGNGVEAYGMKNLFKKNWIKKTAWSCNVLNLMRIFSVFYQSFDDQKRLQKNLNFENVKKSPKNLKNSYQH